MHIIMADVISADGKLTRGNQPGTRQWASAEDSSFFRQLIEDVGVILMGRKTYEVVRQRPRPDRLYIVLTNHPEDFAEQAVAGSLEFMNATPKQVAEQLEKRGVQRLLIVAGSVINGAFFEAGLVDELYLTIEPLIFGAGRPLVEATRTLDVRLQLQSCRQLNEGGTQLLHYAVEPV